MSEIIDHRGQKAVGRKASTLEYFVHWANFNIEDYTWEKEADVVADGDGAGANELVAEYWKRREHLMSRPIAPAATSAAAYFLTAAAGLISMLASSCSNPQLSPLR